MSENVEVKVGVQVDGTKTLSNLKKEIKEAQGQALALSRQFGETSKEAQAAAKRVAELRDEIADVNERVALSDPGAKFQSFGNAVASVTAGFTAAQGAMAIFGNESEDLQRQMVKLQGALNLTQGLSTISDSWKDFQRLGAVIKTNVVSAFTTLKGAIIATGIGALVIALTLVIANFEKVEQAIKKLFPAFEGFGKLFDKVKAIAMGAINSIVEGFKIIGDIVGNIFSGDFKEAAKTANEAGKRMGNAYVEGFNAEVQDQIADATRKATEALIKQQENDLKVLRAGGAVKAKEAAALELSIAQNKVKIIDASDKEGKEKQAAAFADLQALRIQQGQEEGQRQLKELQDRQALQMQAVSDAGKSTIGLRERQLQAQLALEKKYGLDTKGTVQEILQARTADRKAEFDKELAALQKVQDLELQAATIAGKDIFNLKQRQLNNELALHEKYGYSLKETQDRQAAEELERRKKLNDTLQASVHDHNSKILFSLENLVQAQNNLEAARIKNEAENAVRIDDLERIKQSAYESTYELLNSITQDKEGLSEIEQGAAVALAAITEITENNKRSALEKTGIVLKAASAILGQQTAVGKGVAIASTTIDTIVSASASFKGVTQTIPGPWGIALGAAAAAAALIAGYARVRQIQAVKIPGAGNVGGGSLPGGGAPPAPVATVQPNATTLLQAQQQSAQNTTRVVVVESDITNSQKRVASIEENAKF